MVGFDPSTTRFGVALGGERDPKPKSLVWHLPGADNQVFDRTLKVASDSAREILLSTGATDIFIEAPIIISDRSAHTMAALMQLTGAVRAAVPKTCRVHMVASSTVRKHFLQHGRPENPKLAVKNRCKLLGWDFEDDNAADACAVWCYGISLVCPKWSPNGTPLFAERGLAG